MPVKVGVAFLVRSSVEETPVSVAAVMSGVDGGTGAVGSMVMLSTGEMGETLPTASVAVTVIGCVPVVSAGVVNVHTPPAVAVTVPISVPLS